MKKAYFLLMVIALSLLMASCEGGTYSTERKTATPAPPQYWYEDGYFAVIEKPEIVNMGYGRFVCGTLKNISEESLTCTFIKLGAYEYGVSSGIWTSMSASYDPRDYAEILEPGETFEFSAYITDIKNNTNPNTLHVVFINSEEKGQIRSTDKDN